MDGINTQWMQHQKISKFLSMKNIYQATLHTHPHHNLHRCFSWLRWLRHSAPCSNCPHVMITPWGWRALHCLSPLNIQQVIHWCQLLCALCTSLDWLCDHHHWAWHWTQARAGSGETGAGAGGWSRPAWPPLLTRGLLCTRASWSLKVTFH